MAPVPTTLAAMHHQPQRRIRQALAVIVGLTFAGLAHADWLLMQRVTNSQGQVRPAYTWVGENRLRYDDGRMTLIADAHSGQLRVCDHETKTVDSRQLPRPMAPATADFVPEQSSRFRQWPVEHYVLRKRQLHIEVASSEHLPPLLIEQYKRMMHAVGAGADARVNALPGIPLIITVTDATTGALLNRREVLSVVQRTPHAATYRMPSGYRSLNAE